ncbi:hypothetical protein [Stenotrophomonas sp. YIM B06876]|uniref:hypothetical protein n=1 Tax=Stenotrophomonas sp. YIM B06876 TaxID=3060211 RepID=UPI0027396BAB|nr:hypothetical protein [Stenotrophomonas sp. YIM B06876]
METLRARPPGWVRKHWDRIRLYARWWVSVGWRSPRAWRGLLLFGVFFAIALAVFRQPLGDWLWPEPRIQQLLDRGNLALARGHLTAADGSGARELFQAAAALDRDRGDAQLALARTGAAALDRAREAMRRADYPRARQALALARELQMPQAETSPIADQLRLRERDNAGVERLLQQAQAAQAQGHLDDGEDSALPLYQRVLARQPDRLQALEGREDALSDLLLQARSLTTAGDVVAAAGRVRRVQGYDPGHFDLPATQAALSVALEQRRRRAARDLARLRLAAATEGFQQVLQASPDDVGARHGLEAVAAAQAREAMRLAADFKFAEAAAALDQARRLAPASAEVATAQQAMVRARQAQHAMESPLAPAERERRVRLLLTQMETAATRGHWLVPPGNSAYDKYKAVQALAPRDPRVRHAGQRLVPAARQCLEQNLRDNRLRAARTCLEAWQVLAPGGDGLATARRRLAQRWIAVGSERLGAGDAGFAQQALAQARELDATTPEIAAFAERLGSVSPPR